MKRRLVQLKGEPSTKSAQELIFGGEQKPRKGVVATRKTVLLIGGPGSGKRCLIDAFANYLYGVTESSDFRYITSSTPEGGEDEAASGAEAHKRPEVVCSVFNNTKLSYPLAIVDTPSPDQSNALDTFEMIRKWYLGEYYCAVEEFEIWYLLRAMDSTISPDVWQVLNSVVREIECDFVRVIPVITHATKREPRIALSALARIGYIGLREGEDFYTFNTASVLNLDCESNPSGSITFKDNYAHMEQILESLNKHFKWIAVSDGTNVTTAVEVKLNRSSDNCTRFYTTGSFRRSYRAKNYSKKPKAIPEEDEDITQDAREVTNEAAGRSAKKAMSKTNDQNPKQVPEMVMPRMEIKNLSRFAKEREIGEEYEIIRLRRSHVKNYCTQTDTVAASSPEKSHSNLKVSKRNQSVQVRMIPDTKNAPSQTQTPSTKNQSSQVQMTGDAKDAFVQTELRMESTSTETSFFGEMKSTQTSFAEKTSATQTQASMSDAWVQSELDSYLIPDTYFKPIREHGFSQNSPDEKKAVEEEGPSQKFENSAVSSQMGNFNEKAQEPTSDIPIAADKVRSLPSEREAERRTTTPLPQKINAHSGATSRPVSAIVCPRPLRSPRNDPAIYVDGTSNVRPFEQGIVVRSQSSIDAQSNERGDIRLIVKEVHETEERPQKVGPLRRPSQISDANRHPDRASYIGVVRTVSDFAEPLVKKGPSPESGVMKAKTDSSPKVRSPQQARITVVRETPFSNARRRSSGKTNDLVSLKNPANSKGSLGTNDEVPVYSPGITLVRWSDDNAVSIYEEPEPKSSDRKNVAPMFETLV